MLNPRLRDTDFCQLVCSLTRSPSRGPAKEFLQRVQFCFKTKRVAYSEDYFSLSLSLSLSLFQSLSPSLCKHVCECELKRVCLSMQIQVRFNLCGQKSSPQHLKIVWFSRIIEHQRKIKPFSRFRSNKEILFFFKIQKSEKFERATKKRKVRKQEKRTELMKFESRLFAEERHKREEKMRN